ncbi:uncharacterized protein [Dermacentor andersoni]|uniref:uncharacterized protein n=1 Tax=Dermacentor andersoni TaxID=34620 RepID=UPI00241653C7|nr:uncharacterized protein LOC129384174 [Dermacentor andersoni]
MPRRLRTSSSSSECPQSSKSSVPVNKRRLPSAIGTAIGIHERGERAPIALHVSREPVLETFGHVAWKFVPGADSFVSSHATDSAFRVSQAKLFSSSRDRSPLSSSDHGVRMSAITVGQFTDLVVGPFDMAHYSDSSSENQTDSVYRSPKARAPAQRPPAPYLPMLQERVPPWAPGTPHGSVACTAVSTDFGAPSPAYMWTCQELRPKPPQEPAIPRHEVALVKSKGYDLLCRLAVATTVLVKVAVPVVVVFPSVPGRVRNDVATVKAGNLVLEGANSVACKSNVTPCTTCYSTHATPAAVTGARGGGTITPQGEARRCKHRGGTGQGWKANLSSSSSSSSLSSSSQSSSSLSSSSLSSSSQSSSSLSSWPATTGTTWQTSEHPGCEVPREPLLRDVGGLTTQRQRTVATTPAGTRISEDAAATAGSSTSQAPEAMVAASSSVVASSAGKTECEDTGRKRGGACRHIAADGSPSTASLSASSVLGRPSWSETAGSHLR